MSEYLFSIGDICRFCNEEIEIYHSCGSYLDDDVSAEKYQLEIEYNYISLEKYIVTNNAYVAEYSSGILRCGTYYYLSDVLRTTTLCPDKITHRHFSPIFESEKFLSLKSWTTKTFNFSMLEILSSSNSLIESLNKINTLMLFS